MDSELVLAEAVSLCEVENGLDDFDRLVRSCRSYRRFDEGDPVAPGLLVTLVNLARRTSSAANRQPLRYRVVSDAPERDAIFPLLGWAGALKDWDGPEEGERPSGYIVACASGPVSSLTNIDLGISSQTILLAATEAGYGGCMLKNFKPEKVAAALGLPEGIEPLLVIALGAPAEKVVLEPASGAPDGLNYWRTPDGVHHVPKLALEDVLL